MAQAIAFAYWPFLPLFKILFFEYYLKLPQQPPPPRFRRRLCSRWTGHFYIEIHPCQRERGLCHQMLRMSQDLYRRNHSRTQRLRSLWPAIGNVGSFRQASMRSKERRLEVRDCGETGTRLGDRCREHLRSRRLADFDLPVGRHFAFLGHNSGHTGSCNPFGLQGYHR